MPRLRSTHERLRDVRALRKKAKRLRLLAKDVGDNHTVRELSRQFDAEAAKIEHKHRGRH